MHTEKLLFFFVTLTLIATTAVAETNEERIPRSMSGDKGAYFLLDTQKSGNTITTLHKRVGLDSVGYSKTEINCKTKKYRDLAYSETSVKDLKDNPSKWTPLVNGSSKSDLVELVCSKKFN